MFHMEFVNNDNLIAIAPLVSTTENDSIFETNLNKQFVPSDE